jgi:Bacteriorhodopsin
MATGVGAFVADGDYVETLRYVDWALTTPVLVGTIGLLAGVGRRALVAAVVADVMMIVVGYAASLASGPLKWVGFAVSSAFFLGLAYYLFGPFGRTAAEQSFQRRALFAKVRNLTGVLWFVYPAVWLVGPTGLDLMGVSSTAAVITYLDVTAKTGYTLIVANSQGLFDPLLGGATGTAAGADEASAD